MLDKSMSIKIIFLTFIFVILNQGYSFAYFDPGTGSYIVQLLLAFLASCYVFISNPIKYLKEYFKKDKKDKDNTKNNDANKKK
tara:strand:+ start:596 stop:844 length:249 start_codon:yes stop_codon:yes gene_type:complete